MRGTAQQSPAVQQCEGCKKWQAMADANATLVETASRRTERAQQLEAPAVQPVATIDTRDGDLRCLHWNIPLQSLAHGTQLYTLPAVQPDDNGPIDGEPKPCRSCDDSVGFVCESCAETDAFNDACELMEREQQRRAKQGRPIGGEGSLFDGIAWLFTRLDDLESSPAVQPDMVKDAEQT